MKTLNLLLYRQNRITPTNLVFLTATVTDAIGDGDDLIASIRAGVTQWARTTQAGRQTYEYAGNDMNIGDVHGDLEEIVKRFCPDIESVKIESIDSANGYPYDTELCDDIEDDAFELSS